MKKIAKKSKNKWNLFQFKYFSNRILYRVTNRTRLLNLLNKIKIWAFMLDNFFFGVLNLISNSITKALFTIIFHQQFSISLTNILSTQLFWLILGFWTEHLKFFHQQLFEESTIIWKINNCQQYSGSCQRPKNKHPRAFFLFNCLSG